MKVSELISKTRGEALSPISKQDWETISRNEALGQSVGNVLRMADMVRDHLSKRQSYGRPTIQHETVQSELGEALSHVSLVLAQMPLDQEVSGFELPPATRTCLHHSLSTAAVKLSKLMGGHGFIEGSVSSYEYRVRVFGLVAVEGAL